MYTHRTVISRRSMTSRVGPNLAESATVIPGQSSREPIFSSFRMRASSSGRMAILRVQSLIRTTWM